MTNTLRRRFWIELGAASAAILMFAITVVHSAWIELVFGFDPDMRSGALEWALAAGLTLTVVASIILMRYEWSRAKRFMRSMATATAPSDEPSAPGAINR